MQVSLNNNPSHNVEFCEIQTHLSYLILYAFVLICCWCQR